MSNFEPRTVLKKTEDLIASYEQSDRPVPAWLEKLHEFARLACVGLDRETTELTVEFELRFDPAPWPPDCQ